ncbi:tRNA guanosine(34) transglycosylase Tgt [Dietzia sp.]|uniref:tRNA guanosine(34) transglycosylase Tgt n=1 Tax=Dietzia sp. TaxID=1871616 RepID=UPI002FD986BF
MSTTPVEPQSAERPYFEQAARLEVPGTAGGRAGVIATPHGDIATPAFVPVGTKATVKTLLPEQVASTGAQAVLANAYHLYLQPGHDIVDAAGGLGEFMNWPGPTYTDSGGFQVMSLGVGFKKVIEMEAKGTPDDSAVRKNKERLAHVDEEGVTFRSHLDGSSHRFTPEVSMQIQHGLGADIMFAFDELTTLMNTRGYQEQSLERTRRWAQRCIDEHNRLTAEREGKPLQSLWGVIQGAQYEDLRRRAVHGLLEMSDKAEQEGRRGFGGFGIGGALEKENLGTIVGWCTEEMPDSKPRHLLGISEPDDVFTAVENGADTFDCVAPTRLARHGGIYTRSGKVNITKAMFRRDFSPLDPEGDHPVDSAYTRAYLHHMFKAKEFVGPQICTLHNVRFIIRMVDEIRAAITRGTGEYLAYKEDFLGRYYAGPATSAS